MKMIIIRNLTTKDNELIEEVMEATGQKVASKATLQACSEVLLYKRKYYDLERRHFKLLDKLPKE